MKLNKILAMVLCIAMVLSTMTIGVFAAETIDLSTAVDGVITLQSGTYDWNSALAGKTLTIKAEEGATVVFESSNREPGLGGANLTFEGITFNWDNAGYTGLQAAGNMTYNNCIINGQPFLYGVSETFKDCTFNQDNPDCYNLWTYSAKKVNFIGCTFNSAGRSVLAYHEGTDGKELNVSGCEFIASAQADGKAAVEIGSNSCNYVVNIEESSATGFDEGSVSGSTLWNNKTGVEASNKGVLVTVDDEIVAATNGTEDITDTVVARIGTKLYTSFADAIAAAKATASETNPVTIQMLPGVFTQGITLPSDISNVTFKGADNYRTVLKNTAVGHSGGQVATTKNITFDGINFDGSVIGITAIYENTKIENMTIKNCKFHDIVGKTAVSFNTNSLRNLIGFTFTNNTIENVSGGAFSGLVLRAAPTGNIVIANNNISNVAHNAIQMVGAQADAEVTIANNTLASGADEGVLNLSGAKCGIVLENNTINTTEGQNAIAYFGAEAKVGELTYNTLADAIAAAQSGDTITVLNDVKYDTIYTNNKTHWNGDLNYELNINKNVVLDLNGHTIKSIGGSTYSYYALICVRGGSLTIEDSSAAKTGAIICDETAVSDSGIYTIYNNDTLELNGGTISNFTGGYAIESVTGADTKLIINDGATVTSSGIAVRACSQSSTKKQTIAINGGNISGTYALWVPLKNVGKDLMDITISGGVLTGSSNAVLFNTYATGDYSTDSVNISGGVFNGNVLIGNQYSDDANNNALSAALKGKVISGGTFLNNVSEYVVAGSKASGTADGKFIIVATDEVADAVTVEFVEGENQGEFDIYVAAVEDEDVINRLKSVALQFSLTDGFGYTLTPADNVTITEDLEKDDAYAFNYDGKGAIEDTAHAIKLASVKVEGVGAYTFSVVKNYDIAKVSATELNDNIEKTYVVNPASNQGTLVIPANGYTGEIVEATRNLVVNIAFNNEIKDQSVAYTDMLVKLVGSNGYTDEKQIGTEDIAITTGADGKVYAEVDFGAVTVPYRYTVTVSGAGYRTATETAVVGEGTSAFTFDFWNNVKDAEESIIVGGDTMTKNFLAGDIVKDNNINKYDLSAVVSYFGTRQAATSLNKYDLNRDGNIDSEDIAYVLVSFGE